MQEVEILVDFENTKEEVLEILSKFEFIKEKEIYDTYYEDELRPNLKPEENLRTNELFRVRRIGADCLITYKKNHFKGNRWTYSDEYETKAENYETIEKVIEMLGLKKQIVIHNKRRFYKYNDYEIVFEDVENLGLFIEVERVIEGSNDECMKVKSEIRDFINTLGLKNPRELDLGKNQLMLRKKLKRYDIKIHCDEQVYVDES